MITTPSTLRALATLAIVALAPIATPAASDEARTSVRVTVEYTGSGEVDAQHRIWIWLFDTPDFASGAAIPVGEQSLGANDATATFAGLTAAQVWVAVAYDERGGFAGSAPPPAGAPVSLHMENGMPAPVTPGEATSVRIVFDDSNRMPGSPASSE